MNNTITVKAHPVTGAVFTPREANPEWGSYRVEAMSPTFDLRTGIMNINKRVAFVNMRTEDAKQLESEGLLYNNATFTGNIQINETFAPQYQGHEPKVYPQSSPKAGQVVKSGGKPVFRTTKVVPGDAQDVLLPTDNENVVTQNATAVANEQADLA